MNILSLKFRFIMTGVTEVGSTFFKQYASLLEGMFLAGDGVVAN
jgi:hypothetical protein